MTISTRDSDSGPALTETQRRAALATAAAEAERHRQLGEAARAWRSRGARCEVAIDAHPCGELATGSCAHCGVIFCASHQSYDRSPSFRIMADTCRQCQDALMRSAAEGKIAEDRARETKRRQQAETDGRRRRRRRRLTGLVGAVGVGMGAWLGRPAADDWLTSADDVYVKAAQVAGGLTVLAVLFLIGSTRFARGAARLGGITALLTGLVGSVFLLVTLGVTASRHHQETGDWVYPGGPLVGALLWLVGAIMVAAAVRRG